MAMQVSSQDETPGLARAVQDASFQSGNDPDRTRWFMDQALGLFIHWSMDSQLGSVISHSMVGASQDYLTRYIEELPRTFNPTRFDPDEWARQAKVAGIKYVVFTTKHHSGFCMWETATTDFNIMQTPYGQDITRQVVDAFNRDRRRNDKAVMGKAAAQIQHAKARPGSRQGREGIVEMVDGRPNQLRPVADERCGDGNVMEIERPGMCHRRQGRDLRHTVRQGIQLVSDCDGAVPEPQFPPDIHAGADECGIHGRYVGFFQVKDPGKVAIIGCHDDDLDGLCPCRCHGQKEQGRKDP